MDLAVAIHATAFQPELLDQTRQPLIGVGSRRTRPFAPRVVTTCRTASILNSSVYRLLLICTSPIAILYG